MAGSCGQFEASGGGVSPHGYGGLGAAAVAGLGVDGRSVWDVGAGDRCADLVCVAADSVLGATGGDRAACWDCVDDAECGTV